jgi:uncharacterized membrane protein
MIPSSHFHPMLVHFPIALVVFGFLADLTWIFYKKEVCLSRLGLYLLIMGTLSAAAAWLTGTFFTAEMSGSAGEVKEIHELFALITLGVLIITSVLRIMLLYQQNKENAILKWIAFSFYAAAAIFVSITGFYGGSLVFNYMMPI